MQNTVEQVIHLARLNSIYSITDRTAYDLLSLVGSIIEELRGVAEQKGILFSVVISPGKTPKVSSEQLSIIL
jgi:signal transduction histidine kinase